MIDPEALGACRRNKDGWARRALGHFISGGLLAVLLAACDGSPAIGEIEPVGGLSPEAFLPAVDADETATTSAAAPLSVWVVSGMERVGREDPAGTSLLIEVYAARGEYEPFQVVVQAPADGLSGVSLELSALRGPGGAMIGPEQATLYREHYVEVRHPSPDWPGSNHPLGAGWYADALIPFVVPPSMGALPGATLRAVPTTV
ncbi:MAG: hypothetical protein HGB28_04025, partial [Oscillochloris sp.]|nr:hypothetical protein [Oscillochloris sp.]